MMVDLLGLSTSLWVGVGVVDWVRVGHSVDSVGALPLVDCTVPVAVGRSMWFGLFCLAIGW
jgi:hypothetical protein